MKLFYGLSILSIAIALLFGYQTKEIDAFETKNIASTETKQPQKGFLEVVAELPLRPWNHSVTRDGRIFATVVRSDREQPALIEITGRNSYKPFPNNEWNAIFGSSPNVLNSPQGIQIDEQNRLWVIDRETLFYGAMTGTSLWSIPAKLFREGTNDKAIAASVKRVGSKPVSDGISTDTQGNHYITNLGENAISVLSPDGKLSQLARDDRLIWSDSLSFGEPSWLYVAVNQLNRSLLLNPKTDEGKPPYLIVRIWTGTQGVPGR